MPLNLTRVPITIVNGVCVTCHRNGRFQWRVKARLCFQTAPGSYLVAKMQPEKLPPQQQMIDRQTVRSSPSRKH
jgi:hypothetical protein